METLIQDFPIEQIGAIGAVVTILGLGFLWLIWKISSLVIDRLWQASNSLIQAFNGLKTAIEGLNTLQVKANEIDQRTEIRLSVLTESSAKQTQSLDTLTAATSTASKSLTSIATKLETQQNDIRNVIEFADLQKEQNEKVLAAIQGMNLSINNAFEDANKALEKASFEIIRALKPPDPPPDKEPISLDEKKKEIEAQEETESKENLKAA